MNNPLLAEREANSLEQLLGAHFSERALAPLLGFEAARLDEAIWDRALHGPVREFVGRPSKALRAGLLAHCYELAGGRAPCPEQLGAIIEILHAGSLIIDDIEDTSNSRRGAPALHLLHGVPVALNAGNWMYFWALSLVQELQLGEQTELALYRRALRTLLRCHHGQGLDLTTNVYGLRSSDVAAVVRATAELKTGALMELAAVLAAVAAGAAAEVIDAFALFGREMGVALQMLDDLGSLTNRKRCHKGHEDLVLGRPTWPWAWLAAELAPELYGKLQALGEQVAARDVHPELLARRLRAQLRGSGRVRVRRHIQNAFTRLETSVGSAPTLAALRAELSRMEQSYV